MTYHDVEPLLTPRFITFERAAFDADAGDVARGRDALHEPLVPPEHRRLALRAAGGVRSRPRSASFHVGGYELLVRANNLTDSKKYGSGYASDGVSYYYVLPPRNVFVSLRAGF